MVLTKYAGSTGGAVGVLTLLFFLGIIPILDKLRRDLKEQWFSMWSQTSIFLLSHTKRSSVDHILSISSLLVWDPITSFSASSKLLGSCDGLSVRVRRYFPASGISSWPKIHIVQVYPPESSLERSSRVEKYGWIWTFLVSHDIS